MILYIGPWGGVSFSSTSLFFRAIIDDLASLLIHTPDYGSFDFGNGAERAFRCCSCKRFTPLITGSVDHVVPRSRFHRVLLDRPGEVYDSVTYKTYGSVMVCTSGKIRVIRGKDSSLCETTYELKQEDEDADIYMELKGYDKPILLQDALINDMQNLQLMCCYCNSLKGNRT